MRTIGALILIIGVLCILLPLLGLQISLLIALGGTRLIIAILLILLGLGLVSLSPSRL